MAPSPSCPIAARQHTLRSRVTGAGRCSRGEQHTGGPASNTAATPQTTGHPDGSQTLGASCQGSRGHGNSKHLTSRAHGAARAHTQAHVCEQGPTHMQYYIITQPCSSSVTFLMRPTGILELSKGSNGARTPYHKRGKMGPRSFTESYHYSKKSILILKDR